MEMVSIRYLLAMLFMVLGISVCEMIIMITVFSISNRLSDLGDDQRKADEGLIFWKLGDNYIWTTPQEFERIRLTERSE